MTDSEAYVAKQIQLALQFFKDAVDRELLDKSPFAKVLGGSQKTRPDSASSHASSSNVPSTKRPTLNGSSSSRLPATAACAFPARSLALSGRTFAGTRAGSRSSPARRTDVGREEREIPIIRS